MAIEKPPSMLRTVTGEVVGGDFVLLWKLSRNTDRTLACNSSRTHILIIKILAVKSQNNIPHHMARCSQHAAHTRETLFSIDTFGQYDG